MKPEKNEELTDEELWIAREMIENEYDTGCSYYAHADDNPNPQVLSVALWNRKQKEKRIAELREAFDAGYEAGHFNGLQGGEKATLEEDWEHYQKSKQEKSR